MRSRPYRKYKLYRKWTLKLNIRKGSSKLKISKVNLKYLQIHDDLAHDAAHIPGLRDVAEYGRRQTDEKDEEVRNGQVDDEKIRHRPHPVVQPDDETDEEVADDADNEDDGVESDDDPFEFRRNDVVAYHVDVLLVADAVLVRAELRRILRSRIRSGTAGIVRCRFKDGVSNSSFVHDE